MAFELYGAKEVPKKGVDPKAVSVTIAAIERNGGKITNMSILIGGEVLKAMGLALGDKVYRHFGTGEDKGKMLLVKVPKEKPNDGILVGRYNKKSNAEKEGEPGFITSAIRPIKPIEDFAGNSIPKTVVVADIDTESGGLIIALPEGFFTESAPLS